MKGFYNSLSWTNKRRVDNLLSITERFKKWITPKAKKVVSEIELPKFTKKEKETVTKTDIEVLTELFPDNHNYIGYRLEKHENGDKIFLIESPPHPTECVCDKCMKSISKYVESMRKEMRENETKPN